MCEDYEGGGARRRYFCFLKDVRPGKERKDVNDAAPTKHLVILRNKQVFPHLCAFTNHKGQS